jgi:hypothetical protein
MNAIIGEEWKAVPGWEGCYEVSDRGRVRSLDRWVVNQRRRFWAGKVLTPRKATNGYVFITLHDAPRRWQVDIHRLVALTFIGICHDGLEVAHGNGKKDDNRLSNLRYDTRKGNHNDKRMHGTHRQGETHPGAKLTAADALTIYAARATCAASIMAAVYGCTVGNIYAIWNGKSWCSTTGATAKERK